MELLNILNELEELIEESPKVPLSKRVMVDENKILDYIDRIRTTLPDEVRQAKLLIKEREKVINESRREAQQLLENAQRQIEKKANESEVVEMAQNKAKEIIQQAEKIAREIRLGARDYADEILQKMENDLSKLTKQIKAGREELQKMK
ncbi:vacuolar-type H+-ATPase subunit H [Desulfohalotomaculum tongense]|uniref:ATPase n=1 Tax=Desulforadius tongensis TaxID=1216062 RepID=UPI00195956C8|nr:ATPase [Desulforadius tongensis]MBM7856197.1 vacuolar-type H+-ATPase subunit H [Desulforadius tongensis]